MPDELNVVLDYSAQGTTSPQIQIQSVWSWIWDILKGVASAIAQSLTQSITTAAKELASMLTLNNLVGVGINYLKDQASTWLTKAVADMGHNEWLANFLHAAGLDFSDILQAGKNALNAGFNVLTSDLTNALRDAKLLDKGALDMFQALIDRHKDETTKATLAAAQTTQTALTDHGKLISHAFQDWSMFTAQSRSRDEAELHQHLHAIFDETPEKISARSQIESATQYSSLADRSIEEFQDKLPESSQVSFSVLKPIQDQLNDLVVRVRANIWQLLTPQIPVSYENAGVQAAEALFSAIGLGLTAHGLAAAADLIHPLKATAIPQIAAFLADMAGFGAIARATWYEDIHNFLTLPYRYFSQRYFRPTLPRESDVYRMYSKSLIREEDFRRALEYMGYRNEWIDVFVDDCYREPSALNLTLMAQDPTIDLATIYKTLRRGGYSPDISEIFTRAIQIKSLSSFMKDYRDALTSLYANGYISESQLDDQMEPLQLTSEAYFLVKKTAEFQFLKKYIDDEIKMFTDQFEKGLIDDTQLKTILTALGLKPEKIDLIVSAQKIKVQPNILAEENEKIKDEIRKAQQDVIENYLLAYRSGSISADELKQALVLIGFSDEAAGLAVKVEEARQALVVSRKTADTVQRQKEQTIRNYEKAYVYQFRNGLIDADQLRAALSFLGLPDDYVNSVVELEVSKKEKPPKVNIQ